MANQEKETPPTMSRSSERKARKWWMLGGLVMALVSLRTYYVRGNDRGSCHLLGVICDCCHRRFGCIYSGSYNPADLCLGRIGRRMAGPMGSKGRWGNSRGVPQKTPPQSAFTDRPVMEKDSTEPLLPPTACCL
jgi:hypothetical protein